MSREQYTPPTLGGSSSQNATGGSGGYTGGGFNITGSSGANNAAGSSLGDDAHQRAVAYICGDCDAKNQLKTGDAVRCKECGYRVLYKERTTRMVQFEAR